MTAAFPGDRTERRRRLLPASLLLATTLAATTPAAHGAPSTAPAAESLAGSPAGAELPSLEVFRPEGRASSPGDERDAAIERLVNLGSIRVDNGEYAAAIDTFEDAVERIDDAFGPWDQRNVSAWAGLGAAYAGIGRYEEAVGHYEQALYVNRMNQGLHDPSQIPMLDALTELHAEVNAWDKANQLQEYVYYVAQREYGPGSPDVLPYLFRMAQWYQRTGGVFRARALYEEAVAILEDAYGPDDIRLVEPLRGLATTYRLERYPVTGDDGARPEDEEVFTFTSDTLGARNAIPVSDPRTTVNRYGAGERALTRAVEIYEQHPELPARERAQALLDLADWFLIFDKWNSAFETYGEARDLLLAEGWEEAEVTALFAEPQPLVFPLPAPPGPPSGETVERLRGYIDIRYDVTDRGRVRDVDILGADPEGLMDFRTRKAVKAARFRPRFVDGQPADTAGIEYRHSFVYYAAAGE